MGKEHVNFYENIKEALMRLQYTVVMYDGEPYYVLTIADGKADGIFRMYMEPIGREKGSVLNSYGNVPHESDPAHRMKCMDEWMDKNPNSGVIRKMMNSPLFNKYRPFPLGMCNVGGRTLYLERQPLRHTQQGLSQAMLVASEVSLGNIKSRLNAVDIHSPQFRDCVLGIFPEVKDCISNLLDPDIMNDAVGFHRNFAFVRGPVQTLFLAYKGDVIGLLPHGDTSTVRLAKQFAHTKEVVADLNLFGDIIFQ